MTEHRPRYCICGWRNDHPEAEHRHEERMQAAIVRSADAIAWARFGAWTTPQNDGSCLL